MFKRQLILYCFVTTVSLPLWATPPGGKSLMLKEALRAIAACVHWGGEVGSGNLDREKQVTEGVARDCPAAKEKAEEAFKSRPHDKRLQQAILMLNDVGYFDLDVKEKKRICESLLEYYQQEYKKEQTHNALYRFQCPSQAARIY